jgi:hypothetical protein
VAHSPEEEQAVLRNRASGSLPSGETIPNIPVGAIENSQTMRLTPGSSANTNRHFWGDFTGIDRLACASIQGNPKSDTSIGLYH